MHALSAEDTATAPCASLPRPSHGHGDSPPRDLNELAVYTRKEREKFEALAAAHQARMNELMSAALPLSPASSAAGLTPARSAPAAGAEQLSLRQRLEDVQRHFAENREGYSRSLQAAAL